jgi:hypothetical protein
MAGNRTLKLSILADIDNLKKNLAGADKEIQGFGGKLAEFGKKAALALAAVGAAAGAMAVKIGKEAIAAASDLAETTSKVGVIFGDVAKDIEAFGAQAAKSLGQTRTQAMNAAATFATFGKSAGLAGDDLSKFSIEFVQLASDLASFNNTSVDQAINALGAALRGESEPIRAYGVMLNDATLKAKAMEMGIYSGTGTLTAQQKVLAAHKVVLEQTKDAQGDFARTSDGLANSQRILSARIEEAKIVLGTALLPIAQRVVELFNLHFLPVIEKVAAAFGGTEGRPGLIERVKEVVAEVRERLNPIIEALQRAFDRVSDAIRVNEGNFRQVLDAVKVIWNFFKDYFVPYIGARVILAIEGIGIALSGIIKVASPVLGFLSSLIGNIVSIIDKALQAIKNLINLAIDGINKVIAAYNKLPFKDISQIPKLGGGAVTTAQPRIELPFGGGTIGGGTSTGGGAKTGGGVVTGGGTTGAGAGAGGSTGGAIKEAAYNTKKATEKLKETIDDLRPTLASVATFRAFESGDAINYGVAASARSQSVAEFRAREAGITINVNAPSIIDENGFSRVIVDALNSTQARTGGGGSQLVL